MAITKTYVKPLQGQSPIILHNVPQSITVGDITGDKGTNEVWADTKGIEDFTATITTLDEYSTGVPYKKITVTKEFDVEEKTWGEGEESTEEAEEKTFTLNYKGHERDFEIKVVEGGEGSGELEYFTLTDGPRTSYILEVEAPPTGKDLTKMPIIPPVEAYIGVISDIHDDTGLLSVISTEDFKNMYSNLGVGIDWIDAVKGDYLASSQIEGWASHLCYYCSASGGGYPDEEAPIVPVTSSNSSSPKLQIRYRWGMNDSHDLSVEKDITITERPTPSEGGGSDEEEPFVYLCANEWEEGTNRFYAVNKDYVYYGWVSGIEKDSDGEHPFTRSTCPLCLWGIPFEEVEPPQVVAVMNSFLATHPNYVGTCLPGTLISLEKIQDTEEELYTGDGKYIGENTNYDGYYYYLINRRFLNSDETLTIKGGAEPIQSLYIYGLEGWAESEYTDAEPHVINIVLKNIDNYVGFTADAYPITITKDGEDLTIE